MDNFHSTIWRNIQLYIHDYIFIFDIAFGVDCVYGQIAGQFQSLTIK